MSPGVRAVIVKVEAFPVNVVDMTAMKYMQGCCCATGSQYTGDDGLMNKELPCALVTFILTAPLRSYKPGIAV